MLRIPVSDTVLFFSGKIWPFFHLNLFSSFYVNNCKKLGIEPTYLSAAIIFSSGQSERSGPLPENKQKLTEHCKFLLISEIGISNSMTLQQSKKNSGSVFLNSRL